MENVRLIVFTLCLCLIFPVLGYSFTTFSISLTENWDISLDKDRLILAGIILNDAESHNVTFEGDWEEYTVQNQSVRIGWKSGIRDAGTLIIYEDAIFIQKKSPLGRFLNSWIFPQFMWVTAVKTGYTDKAIYNDTIVLNWDPVYNWSRFEVEDGMQCFITPINDTMNITYAVYTYGTLSVTLGEGWEETTDFNFRNFVTWYLGLIIGDQTWGLPEVFTWLIRILSALTILSAVIIAKELIKL